MSDPETKSPTEVPVTSNRTATKIESISMAGAIYAAMYYLSSKSLYKKAGFQKFAFEALKKMGLATIVSMVAGDVVVAFSNAIIQPLVSFIMPSEDLFTYTVPIGRGQHLFIGNFLRTFVVFSISIFIIFLILTILDHGSKIKLKSGKTIGQVAPTYVWYAFTLLVVGVVWWNITYEESNSSTTDPATIAISPEMQTICSNLESLKQATCGEIPVPMLSAEQLSETLEKNNITLSKNTGD